MSASELSYVVDLAVHLSLPEQARLLAQVAANLAQHVQPTPMAADEADLTWTETELAERLAPTIPKTNKEIAAMIEAGLFAEGAKDMRFTEIDDAIMWVEALRREAWKERSSGWATDDD